jgi:hypothetical protein
MSEVESQAATILPIELDMIESAVLPDADLIELKANSRREAVIRRVAAAGFLGVTALTGAAIATGQAGDHRFSHNQAFVQEIQDGVNGTADVLEVVGITAALSAMSVIGAVKASCKRNVQLRTMDQWSSRDLAENSSDDSNQTGPGIGRRALQSTFAGKMPLLASTGVGLAILSTALGTGISEGEQRPINTVFSLLPGDSLLVQYDGVMPMVESDIPRTLADSVLAEAASRGIKASIINENLGVLTRGNQNLTDLSLGVAVTDTSPLHWNSAGGCDNIPISVDKSSGIRIGEHVKLNGISANVVQYATGLNSATGISGKESISASNRVGVLVAENVMNCLKSDPKAPVHAVIMDTPPATAREILSHVNAGDIQSTIITKADYLRNSKKFWDANVLPLTSVLSLFGGLFVAGYSGAKVREGLLRNKAQWSSKLLSGTSVIEVRVTESLRLLKNGVLSTFIGGVGAVVATPFIVNSLESNFQASVGLKEVAVGAAVGIAGPFFGAARSLKNPVRIISPEQSVRS